MSQYASWEKEYNNPKLITNSNEPQVAFKDFVKWLRRKQGVDISGLSVLDLGSGTGKNSIYLAKSGAQTFGIELSKKAVEMSEKQVRIAEVPAKFIQGSFGEKFPFEDNSFDLVLDITSSNSLDEAERTIYLSEVLRTLRPDGYMFVRTLCKDGDKNAKNLLKLNPGKERDTYTMKDIGLTERVFSKEDFVQMYSKDFEILNMEKTTSYTSFGGQSYKRNFWLAYLKKK